jgi:proteasome lid subunit RPN8/RPN11
LGRASATTAVVERCWALVGRRRGRVWYARRVRPTKGERTRVGFDGPWVLDREERRGDVVGFLHTHPDGPARPSRRDVRTMRAWCSAFGKPLLCIIASPGRLDAFRFDDHESDGEPLELAEVFPGDVVIAVENDGR